MMQPPMPPPTPVAGFRPRRPVDSSLPVPYGMETVGQGMGQMSGLGGLIGGSFGLANAMNSANRQAQYGPEAAMKIAGMEQDGQNYRTNASLAARLAGLGMLGRILGGGMGGNFGGRGNAPTGFQSMDSGQFAGFSGR